MALTGNNEDPPKIGGNIWSTAEEPQPSTNAPEFSKANFAAAQVEDMMAKLQLGNLPATARMAIEQEASQYSEPQLQAMVRDIEQVMIALKQGRRPEDIPTGSQLAETVKKEVAKEMQQDATFQQNVMGGILGVETKEEKGNWFTAIGNMFSGIFSPKTKDMALFEGQKLANNGVEYLDQVSWASLSNLSAPNIGQAATRVAGLGGR